MRATKGRGDVARGNEAALYLSHLTLLTAPLRRRIVQACERIAEEIGMFDSRRPAPKDAENGVKDNNYTLCSIRIVSSSLLCWMYLPGESMRIEARRPWHGDIQRAAWGANQTRYTPPFRANDCVRCKKNRSFSASPFELFCAPSISTTPYFTRAS